MNEREPLARSARWFWQGVALWTILLSLLAAFSAWQVLAGFIVDFLRSKWALLFAGLGLAIALSIWLLLALGRGRYVRFVARVERLSGSSLLAKLVALLTIPACIWLYFFVQDVIFKERIPLAGMLWVFWVLVLASGLALKAAFGGSSPEMLALPILTQGVIFRVLTFAREVSRYPFSLGWSEASRYYYASLPFAGRLYDQHIPLSILHPTRYFLQAIPFLIPGTPLWADRLWQVILWLGMTAVTALLLVWRLHWRHGAGRLKPGGPLFAGLLAMWFFLYLFQGAVYYYLQICIWIVLLGTSSRHPWRSLFAVLLASVWAGMSRINWFPVPAMLAAGIYFLDTPVRTRGWVRYLIQPLIWLAAGLAVAFASQAFYIYGSGNSANAAAFGSSFSSDLLWYRLWPNPTFAPGVMLGILLVALPPLAVIGQYVATKGRALHPVRWLGLAGMLAVLWAGGLVASVKIGGGGDLHNMDAFLTLLGLVGVYLFMDHAAAEREDPVPFEPHYALTLFAMLVPVAFALLFYRPPRSLDFTGASRDLGTIQAFAGQAAKRGGQVLFINQRHLLTFGYVGQVPLVPDYEKLVLMEMAVSNNRDYLQRFYSDLDLHRYALIIAPSLKSKNEFAGQFADEDNVWGRRVDRFLNCEYQVRVSLPEVGLDLLVPRPENPVCR